MNFRISTLPETGFKAEESHKNITCIELLKV